MGWAADLQILRYRTTRAELCRGWFGAAPDLAELAEDFGLDAADVESSPTTPCGDFRTPERRSYLTGRDQSTVRTASAFAFQVVLAGLAE
jgi:hypothetical protein